MKLGHAIAGPTVPPHGDSNDASCRSLLVEQIISFERSYGFLKTIRFAVESLVSIEPPLKDVLTKTPRSALAHGNVREDEKQKLEPHLLTLKDYDLIEFSFKVVNLAPFEDGWFSTFELTIKVQPAFYNVAKELSRSE